MLFSFLGYGQLLHQYYVFFQRDCNYTHLTTGQELFAGMDKDNQTVTDVPLGFTFNYNGVNYTTINIGIDGAARFGTYQAVYYNNDLASNNEVNMIAPLWDNLYIRSADNGKVIYATLGQSGQRKFVIEWQNVSWRSQGQTVSFKLILYEGTNNIEFQYGPNNSTEGNRTASIGLNQKISGVNNDNTMFLSVTPDTDYATVSAASANNNIHSNEYPGEGVSYQFKHMTWVPDPNLEHYFETHKVNRQVVPVGDPNSMGNGIDGDHYIFTRRLNHAFLMFLQNLNIVSAIGLEDIKDMEALDIYGNNLLSLTNLDNPNLQRIDMSGNNQLSSVDLSKLPALKNLRIWHCNLNQIDLSHNPLLEEVYMPDNNLTSLNISTNSNLIKLDVSNNQISQINFGNIQQIERLVVSNNPLADLDLTQFDNLKELQASGNGLQTLTFSPNATLLQTVYCFNNNLQNLDLTMMSGFGLTSNMSVICRNNPDLKSIDMRNGANHITDFDARTCPELTCIFVDDTSAPELINWQKDPTAHFVANQSECDNYATTYIADANFEHYLETHDANGNTVSIGSANSMGNGTDGDHLVLTARIKNVANLNISNQNIADLTGIEDFEALFILTANNNQITSADFSQNTSLTSLNLKYNQITSIDISQNSSLQNLFLSHNNLYSIDLSHNPVLHGLEVSYNHLYSLDISHNIIQTLRCEHNQISQIYANDFSNLTFLTCDYNMIQSLDLVTASNLSVLSCSYNLLQNLVLTQNTQLTELMCSNNQLTTLDLSHQNQLTKIICNNNQLTSLDVRNGNNSNISTVNFQSQNNPDLSCIYVDNPSWSQTNWTNVDATSHFVADATGCDLATRWTYVPDDNFEAYLEAHNMGNGIANDDYVSTGNIENVTNLSMPNKNISDLTGIEDFATLQILNIQNNQISQLDLSANTNLQQLLASYNQLSGITLNTSIQNLILSHNQFSGSVDFSNYHDLIQLILSYNQIASLDISGCGYLTSLNISNNQIVNLDLSHNVNLAELYANNNLLADINFGTLNDFTNIYLSNNRLVDLNFDAQTQLDELFVDNNHLSNLSVQNGVNTSMSEMYAVNNPNLTCIFVDDATWAQTNWTNIDATAHFVNNQTECDALTQTTYVPDDNFEQYLETHNIYGTAVSMGDANSMGNGVMDDYVPTHKIETAGQLYIGNHNIADLTGLEDFTNLQYLLVNNNQLTHLDLSNNLQLVSVNCSNNQISVLHVGHLTNLRYLSIYNNQISQIDVSQNTDLREITVSNNPITALDLSQNTALTKIVANDMPQLSFLDLRNGNNTAIADNKYYTTNDPNLTCVYVDDAAWSQSNWSHVDSQIHFVTDATGCDLATRLTYIPDDNFEAYLETNGMGNGIANDDYVSTANIENVTTLNINNQNIADLTGIEDFVSLTHLEVANNQLTSIDVSHNTALTYLYISGNNLGNIDVSALSSLQYLIAYNAGLNNIDVSNNTNLRFLDVQLNSAISSLDVSHNLQLQYLYAGNDALTSIDVTQNLQLKHLNLKNNQIASLVLDSNNHLERLDVTNNNLTELSVKNGANNLLSGTYTLGGNNIARFKATGNPDLTCIYVDNPTDANNGTGDYQDWEKDDTATYVSDAVACDLATRLTYVPDDNFEAFLEAVGRGNGIANDNYVSTANIEHIIILHIERQHIADLTGIEDFSALQELYCQINDLSSLDLSQNADLTVLDCSFNNLTQLTLNNALTDLDCSRNQLTSIDISALTDLVNFRCNYNNITSLNFTNNHNISTLSCSSNQLSTLDITGITNLHNLNCSGNNLTSLNTTGLSNLLSINCGNNQLTNLEVNGLPYLAGLSCHNNQLSSLDVSNLIYLDNLFCPGNQLTTLDLSAQTRLDYLVAYNNQLTDLNIQNGNNANVTYFDVRNNPDLTCIQVDDPNASYLSNWNKDNTAQYRIDCSIVYYDLTVNTTGNGSVTRNPAGGNYQEGTDVTLTATPDAGWEFAGWSGDLSGTTNPATITMDSDKTVTATFTRIQHTLTVNTTGNGSVNLSPAGGTYDEGTTVTLTATPDTTWEFAGWSGDLSGTSNPATIVMDSDKTITATFTQMPQTYVPDDNFEAYLEANGMGNGIANDDHVTTANISNVTNLDISGQNISNLTGIEDFAALQQLNANNNQLTQADFSGNTNLQILSLDENNLTAIDVSNNTQLSNLSVATNQLTALSVINNTHLQILDCNHNQLTDLDVSHNTLLVSLNFDHNNISSIDVSQNTQLSYLMCFNNQLSSLDVSNLPDLTALICNDNQITNIDVSQNHNLAYLWVHNNQLTSLDVRNSNNGNLNGTVVVDGVTQAKFRATGNPDLSCIYVDNPTDANNGTGDYSYWQKDVATIFTANATECDLQTRLTYVPDDNFETYLEANGMGNGIANDDHVSTANIENVTNLDIHNLNISDLTGIEDFAALSQLKAYNNHLTNIDISHNTLLSHLEIHNNQLSALNLSQNTALTYLDMGGNNISSIDLSNNTALTTLKTHGNLLTSIDAAMLTALVWLDCSNNQLTDLNVQNGNNANVTFFNAQNNPNLTCIQVDDPNASYLSNWLKDNTANYSDDCSIVYYDLTVNVVGNGSVTPSNGTYVDGTNVTLNATPDTGWEFAGWSGVLSGTTNPATITMDSDKTITATFTRIQHTLTVNTTGNGSVNLSPAGGTYDEGTTVTLTATPDTGWEFSGWSGDLSGTTNPATITMDSNKTVTATFTEIIPDYCYAYGNTTFDTSVTRVQFNTIDNSTGKDTDANGNAYSDFTSMITDVHRESAYDLNIQVNTAGSYTVYTKVWIDWNQDLDFDDAGEEYDLGTAYDVTDGLTSLSPLSITIPSDAALGNTRMRVAARYNTFATPCYQGFDGEVEDYTINVHEAVNIEEYARLLTVYPNPVNNLLHIQSNTRKPIEIYLYNLIGQELIHRSAQTGKLTIELNKLPSANYLLQIIINNHIVNYNIVKE